MPPLVLRLRSFWLGLPVFLFIAWGWADSMRHDTRANHPHGPMITRKGKLAEKNYRRSAPESPARLPGFPGSLSENSGFSGIPSGGFPFRPYNPPPSQIIDPVLEAPTVSVQRCISIGNKQGTVWISFWETIPHRMLQTWRRDRIAGTATWFPAFDYQSGSGASARSLWLPHWLLLSAYSVPWAALVVWRRGRRLKGLRDLA